MYAMGSGSGGEGDAKGSDEQSKAGLGKAQAMLVSLGGKELAKKFKLPKQCKEEV